MLVASGLPMGWARKSRRILQVVSRKGEFRDGLCLT